MMSWFPSALSYMKRYFFYFNRESMFAMRLFSNQTFMNPGRAASILMILVPRLQRTWMKRPHALWMSFTSSLFMITFTMNCLSRSSHHGLNYFPDPWVLFLLFSNEYLSVPLRMRLFIPLMLESIVYGSLMISLTPSENS